jgi:hypothetical protein
MIPFKKSLKKHIKLDCALGMKIVGYNFVEIINIWLLKYRGSADVISGRWWNTFIFGVAIKGNGSISPAERGNG